MKLVIGKSDESEIVIAEECGESWKPNPNVVADLQKFLHGPTPSSLKCGSRRTNRSKPIHRRVAMTPAAWHVLNCLALQSGRSFQEIADEVFGDLLKKLAVRGRVACGRFSATHQ